MSPNKFWLYDWIDTLEIKHFSQAESLLQDAGLRKDLRNRISEVPFRPAKLSSDVPSIVAGRAIDLSGELDCFGWGCMKKQFDKLFSHVWHYFDQIVIVGPSAHAFTTQWDAKSEQLAVKRLLTYTRLLLYIREIGAEDLVVFTEKRPACEVHVEDQLGELGFDFNTVLSGEIIDPLTRRAEISVTTHEEHLHYKFDHPAFEHSVWGVVDNASGKERDRLVAISVIKRYLAGLVSDIHTARVLKSPLGSTVNFHGQLLKIFRRRVSDADVAFNLALPILDGIDPATLIQIRRDETPYFDNFRHKLRLAINAKLENTSTPDPAVIANEIRQDIINPSLTEIEIRLKQAKIAMGKKAALSVTLGALATTCGVLTANPILTAAGATAAFGGSLTAGQKFIEEKRDVALSDMYFLWRALEHTKDHE